MGVDTKLFLNSSVELRDIKDVIERKFKTKVKVSSTHSPDFQSWGFKVEKNPRSMSVFFNCLEAGFRGTLLSLGCNPQGQEILKAIAQVFGGFYEANDCDGVIERLDGDLTPHNGLPFFIKHAIVTKGIDPNDLTALKEVITEFENKSRYGSKIKGLK